MKVALKITGSLLDQVRRDLARPHFFAHERVGFLTAGATAMPGGGLMLLVREYMPVADEDYEVDPKVGARIGSNAMRKAAQAAYRPAAALLHVHTHGGRGLPGFSGVDLESGNKFVPGFFSMPENAARAAGAEQQRRDRPPVARTEQTFCVDRPFHPHRSTDRRAMECEI